MAALLHSQSRLAASSSRGDTSRSRVRLQTALGILLLINAVLLFFLLRSGGSTAAERADELARLEASHRLAERKVSKLRQLKQEVQDATQNEQRFAEGNFLSRSAAFSRMLADLERLAADNKLQPTDATYRLNESGNKLGWVNVEVSLQMQGEYPDLVHFLNQLEQSHLFWIIESLDVDGQTGQNLRLNLQAATYLLPS